MIRFVCILRPVLMGSNKKKTFEICGYFRVLRAANFEEYFNQSCDMFLGNSAHFNNNVTKNKSTILKQCLLKSIKHI